MPASTRANPSCGTELTGAAHQRAGDVLESHDRSPAITHPQLRFVRRHRDAAEIGITLDHITATVIKDEQKPAAKVRESGLSADGGVECRDDWAQVRQAAYSAAQRRTHDVAHEFVRVRRQEASAPQFDEDVVGQMPLDHRQSTDLEIGATGEQHSPIPVPFSDVDE